MFDSIEGMFPYRQAIELAMGMLIPDFPLSTES